MVDSYIVLTGQTIAYTAYVLVIMLLVGWFSYKITKDEKSKEIKPVYFYSLVGFLVVIGVSLHIVTHETIPWKAMDLNRAEIKADKEFHITMANHQMKLPSEKLMINKNDKARFIVESEDLTYGFGLFREDNSMVFQMQVIPGHINDILWQFDRPAVYSIRSTEYSGPKGINMILRNSVEVIE